MAEPAEVLNQEPEQEKYAPVIGLYGIDDLNAPDAASQAHTPAPAERHQQPESGTRQVIDTPPYQEQQQHQAQPQQQAAQPQQKKPDAPHHLPPQEQETEDPAFHMHGHGKCRNIHHLLGAEACDCEHVHPDRCHRNTKNGIGPKKVAGDYVFEVYGGGYFLKSAHRVSKDQAVDFWGKRRSFFGGMPDFNKHEVRGMLEAIRIEGKLNVVGVYRENTRKQNEMFWDALMEQNLKAIIDGKPAARFIRLSGFTPDDMANKIEELYDRAGVKDQYIKDAFMRGLHGQPLNLTGMRGVHGVDAPRPAEPAATGAAAAAGAAAGAAAASPDSVKRAIYGARDKIADSARWAVDKLRGKKAAEQLPFVQPQAAWPQHANNGMPFTPPPPAPVAGAAPDLNVAPLPSFAPPSSKPAARQDIPDLEVPSSAVKNAMPFIPPLIPPLRVPAARKGDTAPVSTGPAGTLKMPHALVSDVAPKTEKLLPPSSKAAPDTQVMSREPGFADDDSPPKTMKSEDLVRRQAQKTEPLGSPASAPVSSAQPYSGVIEPVTPSAPVPSSVTFAPLSDDGVKNTRSLMPAMVKAGFVPGLPAAAPESAAPVRSSRDTLVNSAPPPSSEIMVESSEVIVSSRDVLPTSAAKSEPKPVVVETITTSDVPLSSRKPLPVEIVNPVSSVPPPPSTEKPRYRVADEEPVPSMRMMAQFQRSQSQDLAALAEGPPASTKRGPSAEQPPPGSKPL